jgi:RNA polymerase sigma-70 factor (ECF subfamily)
MVPGDTRAIIERARAGDRSAFDQLADRFRGALSSVIARRLGGALRHETQVDDVLQETFVRAFQSLGRFEWLEKDQGIDGGERASPFFRWLCGISVRVILEHARRHRARPPIALDFDVPDGDAVSPGRALARRERLERFEAALARLSEDHRTALRLVRIEGLPLAEVARRMDRPPNAVSQLVLRALRSLRREFGEPSETDSGRLPSGGHRPPETREEEGNHREG